MARRAGSDAELVARCRAGDAAAWNELVERFSRYVFARVYAQLDRLRSDDSFRPWLAQLTRRACIDRLRAGSRETPTDQLEPAGVDETLSLLDEALAVHDALGELPDHCREILERFFARDESYRTIGEALALPSGTVASRISRCLDRLKALLEETGGAGRPEDG